MQKKYILQGVVTSYTVCNIMFLFIFLGAGPDADVPDPGEQLRELPRDAGGPLPVQPLPQQRPRRRRHQLHQRPTQLA